MRSVRAFRTLRLADHYRSALGRRPVSLMAGLNLTPGVEFWALLPAFIIVTMVGAIETVGDGIAIQQVSRRRPRATDFRVVQGALNADGVGNLLSGLMGTLPNTTYSSSL